MNLKEFEIVDKIFRQAVDNMTMDNINGYTKDALFRKWCELEIEITEKEQPVKCPTCKDYGDCNTPITNKCEPPIIKKFHINVSALTSQEQLKLFSEIFRFTDNELPDNKILNVEIER